MNSMITWPEIFTHPELVKTMPPAALCADAICGWANCHAGSQPPENFGAVLLAIADRLGMSEAPLGEHLITWAKAHVSDAVLDANPLAA